jgi:hypothetical protein
VAKPVRRSRAVRRTTDASLVPLFYKEGFDALGAQRLSSFQDTLTLGMTGWF